MHYHHHQAQAKLLDHLLHHDALGNYAPLPDPTKPLADIQDRSHFPDFLRGGGSGGIVGEGSEVRISPLTPVLQTNAKASVTAISSSIATESTSISSSASCRYSSMAAPSAGGAHFPSMSSIYKSNSNNISSIASSLPPSLSAPIACQNNTIDTPSSIVNTVTAVGNGKVDSKKKKLKGTVIYL